MPPHIFISATTQGLAPYRDIARDIVQAQGFTAHVQEHFPLPQEPLTTEIKRKIIESDAIIAIIGPYYGAESIFERNGDRMSYTQFEFHFAMEKRKAGIVLCTGANFRVEPTDGSRPPEQPPEFARRQAAFIAEVKGAADLRWGRYSFNDRYEFAFALARLRWDRWCPRERGFV